MKGFQPHLIEPRGGRPKVIMKPTVITRQPYARHIRKQQSIKSAEIAVDTKDSGGRAAPTPLRLRLTPGVLAKSSIIIGWLVPSSIIGTPQSLSFHDNLKAYRLSHGCGFSAP